MSDKTDNRPPLIGKTIADILSERGVDTTALEEGRAAKANILRFAKLIRTAREAAGLSQTELAEKAEMAQPDISRIENGQGLEGPSIKTIGRLAEALDCDLSVQFKPHTHQDPSADQVTVVVLERPLNVRLRFGETRKRHRMFGRIKTYKVRGVASKTVETESRARAFKGVMGGRGKRWGGRLSSPEKIKGKNFREYDVDEMSKDELKQMVKLLSTAE